ncbi:fibronectin type III domain-containing protein [Marinobacter sp. DUT-1]|uniref:fibronectin type III domain-containing protein n=1 Tax=Marinobacter sp. DUT-1 TaxID=3412037 RepID=UPI003D171DC7
MTASESNAVTQTQEPGVEVAGAAMKGVIQKGIVTANRLLADKDGYYAPDRLAAKPVLTADDGSYDLRLRGKADGWALVTLEADGATRMICDVVPRCDQAGAEAVAFGQPMSLDSQFSLRGAGDLTTETVHLTPLTHLAVTLAERSANGLSPEALSGAYQTVEGWFGLSAGSLRLAPPDLTRLDNLGSVSADALQVSIANAAFLALVNDSAQWSTISEVLNNMTSQIAATGQIDIMGDGINVALADLVSAAALQSSELQATVESSVISQKLVVVEYRNVQRFKTIADVYADSDTAVADSEGSADSSEGTIDSGSDTTTGTTQDGTGEQVADNTDTTATDNSGDTVADNGTDTSEPPATDTVQEPAIPADAALLSWTAPLTRENGESLSMGEIAGFEVVYGTNPDSLDQSLAIGDASVDELLVDELTAGTWYFAIRTLDTDGNRSRLSEVVYKQI